MTGQILFSGTCVESYVSLQWGYIILPNRITDLTSEAVVIHLPEPRQTIISVDGLDTMGYHLVPASVPYAQRANRSK